MSLYKLDHVIQECVANYKTKGMAPGAKNEIYSSTWVALNAWIESKLAKQKGAGVSGLGCFAWEIKQKNGEAACRPIFVISEAFAKTFQVKRERVFRLPRTTPVENVNFSMIAIKYSNSLTKDMVFIGIRDIIKKIGDFVYRGYDLEIEFSFGKLIAKDKKVKFEFNQSRLAQMLPEAMETGFFQYDSANLAYNLDDEDLPNNGATNFMDALEDADYYNSAPPSSRSRPPSVLPPLNSARPTHFNHQPPTPATTSRPSSENTNTMRFQDTGIPESSDEWERQETPIPAELTAILNRLGNKDLGLSKDEFRAKAVAGVMEQAYLRNLNIIENEAMMDDKIDAVAYQERVDWKQTLSDKKHHIAGEGAELRGALYAQQQINEQRRKDERQEQLQSKMHVFVGTDARPVSKEAKKQLRADLNHQMAEKVDRNSTLKQQNLTKERDYLKQLSMELDLHKVIERASHLEKQKSLLEAWERDGHVRNLRKVQSYGQGAVKDYIDSNLGDVSNTLMMAPSLGKSLNMSIGYDPRHSKK
jgi:hypothetical protein